MSTKKLKQIENQIQKIKDELWEIGEVRPGSLTLQYTDFSRLISAPLHRGDLGTRFRTHTGFLSQFAGLDFPTMKLDSGLHLCVV